MHWPCPTPGAQRCCCFRIWEQQHVWQRAHQAGMGFSNLCSPAWWCVAWHHAVAWRIAGHAPASRASRQHRRDRVCIPRQTNFNIIQTTIIANTMHSISYCIPTRGGRGGEAAADARATGEAQGLCAVGNAQPQLRSRRCTMPMHMP